MQAAQEAGVTWRPSDIWRMPDELWAVMQPLLPAKPEPKRKGSGRPRVDARRTMEGILYVLRTGCQWKALPRHFGRPSTVHRWFQTWARAGVFAKFWQVGLQRYDDLAGIDWSWQSMDGATTKAPLGGKKNGSQSHGSRQIRR